MRLLALDTSQLQAVCCLLEDGRIKASRAGSVEVAHSEGVLSLVDGLLVEAGWSIGQVDEFGVGVGPGSFTGIRIGCATIKALAQVLKRPVRLFSSLKALAYSAVGEGQRPAVALVNAYQGQVFAGWLDSAVSWREAALTASELGQRLSHTGGGPLVICGSGAKLYWSEIGQIARAELSPVAYTTAQGLARAVVEAEPVSYQGVAAHYLRPSAAEDKLSALADSKGT